MSNHKHLNLNNRRNFLRKLAGAGCASLTLTPLLSGITNLGLINAAAASNKPIYSNPDSDYKALVCIMLAGGNDSFNMLTPTNADQHAAYATQRGGVYNETTNPTGMGLGLNDLILLDGIEYGLHPKMKHIADLYDGTDGDKYVSFVANVGTLVQPLNNLDNYRDSLNYKKPSQLFSHSNQQMSWQTGMSEGNEGTGWIGRTADILKSCNTYQDISMNISLNGLNIFQRGKEITEYVIQDKGNGSIKLIDNFFDEELHGGSNFYYATRDSSMNNILDANYQNVLEQAYAKTMTKALGNSDAFSTSISSFSMPFTTPFPNTSIGNQLHMVAKAIATRNTLANSVDSNQEIRRQTFYVVMDGFDNHNELIAKHAYNMEELDCAIYAFYKAMKEIALREGDSDFSKRVTGFTMSDFARTLSSNGDGSDHAWGGHHLVFGGAINGGNIFGEYPDLEDNDLDVGNGRFIPKISCDEYFADLALWFGAEANDLYDILPNIDKFWTPTGTSGPLGLFV